jgi:MSHA pilin protein MshA
MEKGGKEKMKPKVLRSKLKKKMMGFTLIELIMVIVILAILAAVAIPRFFNLSTDARQAAEAGVVGGIRAGIQTYIASPSNTSRGWPTDLDGLAAATCGAGTAACFDNVLAQGGVITTDWAKTANGATVDTYTGPTPTTYTYNNATGQFY